MTMIWLKEWDKNTKFFHKFANVNQSRKRIVEIKREDGTMTQTMEEENQEVLIHFQSIMNRDALIYNDERGRFLNRIPSLINETDNLELYKLVSLEEVRIATFQFNPNKAPGPYGFLARFFQHFWDIVKHDLWKVVEESKRKTTMLGEMNHTFIALVPKKKKV